MSDSLRGTYCAEASHCAEVACERKDERENEFEVDVDCDADDDERVDPDCLAPPMLMRGSTMMFGCCSVSGASSTGAAGFCAARIRLCSSGAFCNTTPFWPSLIPVWVLRINGGPSARATPCASVNATANVAAGSQTVKNG